MADPATLEEYTQRFAAAQSVTGSGKAVRTHVPCPFCAAPDFILLPTSGIEAELAKTRRCSACGRSGRGLVVSTAEGMWVAFERVAGPAVPAWLLLSPRRVQGGFNPGRMHPVDLSELPRSVTKALNGSSGA